MRCSRRSNPWERARYTLDLIWKRQVAVPQSLRRFKADGSIDEPALLSLVNWQIESGIDFLVACGSTGEAATLDEDEWLQAIRSWSKRRRAACRYGPGCTHNSTRTLLRQAAQLRKCAEWTPFFRPIRTTTSPRRRDNSSIFWRWRERLIRCRCALYNVPGRTAVNLEPATVARLADAAANIQAVKEASGKLPQFAELVHMLPRGFKIFSGDDNLALAAIGVGADGLISVARTRRRRRWDGMVRAALSNRLGRRRASWSAGLRGSSMPTSGIRIPAR